MKRLIFVLCVGTCIAACNNSDDDVNHSNIPDSNSVPPYDNSAGNRSRLDSMGNTRDTVSLDSINKKDSPASRRQ